MITKHEAVQIAESLISTRFPELTHKRIRYQFVAGKRYYFYMAVRWLVFEYRIYIEKEILQFSEEAFSVCIAHELAHIVIETKKFFLCDFWQFLTLSKVNSDEERKADILVIERGLGKALLQFHKEHGKEYKSYNASEGMTKREIKKYIESR